MPAKDTISCTPEVNTDPKNLLKLVKSLDGIHVLCRAAVKEPWGWTCYGVTYDNCGDVPDWHNEPLDLLDEEVEVWFKIRYGGKSEV